MYSRYKCRDVCSGNIPLLHTVSLLSYNHTPFE